MIQIASFSLTLATCLLLFNHLTFIRFAEIEISISYLIVGIFISFNVIAVGAQVSRKLLIFILFVALVVAFKMATQLGTQLGSVALIFISVCAFSGAFLISIYSDNHLKRRVAKIIIGVTAFHALFLITQAIAFNVFDNLSLLNPLGPFSPMGPRSHGGFYEPHYYRGTYLRPNGFFSEPSAAALFQLLGAVHCAGYNLAKKYLPLILIILISIVATLSMAGALGAIFVGVYFSIVQKKLHVSIMSKVLIGAFFLAVMSYVFFSLFESRADEIFDPSKSIYVRITAPVLLISDVLIEKPIGLPIGNLEFVRQFDYWPKGVSGNSIDNGLFALIVFFGWLGIIFLFECLRVSLSYSLKVPNRLLFVSLIWMGLFFNGGIWGPKAMSLTCILIAMMPKSQNISTMDAHKLHVLN